MRAPLLSNPRTQRLRALTFGFLAAAVGGLLSVTPACHRPAGDDTSAPPPQPSVPAWFEDVADTVGLNFVHDPGPTGTFFMPQSMGSGCAFLDADGDGLTDIYLLQTAGPTSPSVNRLYRQVSGGKFVDATDGSGLGVAGFGQGVAVGDVNNDGRPDVLVTEFNRSRLFVNRGGGKYEEAGPEAGVFNPLWGTSAAFLDYDRDGWLDLFVVNYLDYDPSKECFSARGEKTFCTPPKFPSARSKLFRNRGPGPDGRPRFEDVSLAAGLARVPGPGLGVVVADFDGDGWADIFVANDGDANRLWVNRHDGTFADEAVSRGVAYTAMGRAYAGMGVGAGDADNDGLLDLFVTHLNTETNTLWRQGPRGVFADRTAQAGLTKTDWRGTGFGTLLADFDNDGAVDIAVANGRILPGGTAAGTGLGFWETYAEKNQLFANDGTGKFRDLSASNPALCGVWNVGRGLAVADYDNDGGMDLLVTTIGGRARLYRNVTPARGHWVKVRAIDPKLRRDAYGAEIVVHAGGRKWMRIVSPAASYLASNAAAVHFGLGSAAAVDRVEVLWPDGVREVFPGGPADRLVEVRRAGGSVP